MLTAPAQWHQWLRHTRPDPPSMHEQQMDVQRQIQLKQLAQLADERWASKASYLDKPEDTEQLRPATLPRDPGGYVGNAEEQGEEGVSSAVTGASGDAGEQAKPDRKDRRRNTVEEKQKENPWKVHRGGPSEKWQPEAWKPGPAARRL